MSSIQPITSDRYGSKCWQRPRDYRFATTTNVAPLAATEIAKAVHIFPLAFVEHQGRWSLSAVLGLAPGQNLFIARSGQWAATYIPAAFRSYPFRLGRSDTDQYVPCVDEASGLVADGQEGTPFFNPDGSLTEETKQALTALLQTAHSQETVSQACAALAEQGAIEPWTLTIKNGDQARQVTGLHRINEAALNSLPDESFLALRRAGALPIAYAQLLSMANLANLGKLAQAHANAAVAAASVAQTVSLDKSFGLADSDTVNFDAVKWDD